MSPDWSCEPPKYLCFCESGNADWSCEPPRYLCFCESGNADCVILRTAVPRCGGGVITRRNEVAPHGMRAKKRNRM